MSSGIVMVRYFCILSAALDCSCLELQSSYTVELLPFATRRGSRKNKLNLCRGQVRWPTLLSSEAWLSPTAHLPARTLASQLAEGQGEEKKRSGAPQSRHTKH